MRDAAARAPHVNALHFVDERQIHLMPRVAPVAGKSRQRSKSGYLDAARGHFRRIGIATFGAG